MNNEPSDGLLRIGQPEFWQHLILNDLYFLCRAILITLEDATPGYKDLYYPTHKRICDFVQNNANPGQKLIILTPRGWVKSYIITVGWTIQRLLRNLVSGSREIGLITNATIENALLFLKKIKHNLINNDLLRGLFQEYIPHNVEGAAGVWSAEELELGGFDLMTGAVEKNLVSQHHGFHIHDDLVNKENSDTPGQLIKTYDWWGLAQALLSPRGVEIIIGTRWDFDDLYGRVIEKFITEDRNYFIGRAYTEIHNGNYHLLHINCWEDPINERGSTFPTLWPDELLYEQKKKLGPRWYGQYENNPIKAGKNPFSQSWFTRWNDKDLPQVRYSVLLCDPSGKAKSTESSYTGISYIHFGSDRKGYIEYGKRHLVTDMKLANLLIDLALRFRPDNIGIEDTKYATILDLLELIIANKIRRQEVTEEEAEFLKTLPNMFIELRPKGRPKPVRIKQLTGFLETGQFMLPYVGAEELEDELVRYPAMKDDIVDSLAYALDVMAFPKPNDPPKLLIVPEKLKMTTEERIEEEWDRIRDEVFADGHPTEGFPDYDTF